MAFDKRCGDAARDFLQTVIIIDDGLSVSAREATPAPKVAARTSGSLLNRGSAEKQDAAAPLPIKPSMSHPLNALELTDAFFHEGMVAGLFKPTPETKHGIIEDSVAVAKKCDAVIIDWTLEDPDKGGALKQEKGVESDHLATGIIIKLVSDDYRHGGRLRTIIVYTAEKDLTVLRDELIVSLSRAGITDFLTKEQIQFKVDGKFSIASPNLKIAFYGKSDSGTPHADRKKSESQLPQVVIEEFASHVKGLLPTFALRSTAAIRRNTHHLLTRFPDDLDGAYLAHRGMIPDPEDAEPYMLENLVSVIRNTLSLEQVDRKCLGQEPISLWTEQATEKNIRFSGKCQGKDIDCSPEELNEVFLNGTEKLKSLIAEKTGVKKKEIDFDKAFAEAGKIISAAQSDALQRFSVLSAFKRSHADIGWASPDNSPYLTQGTIIAKVLANNEFDFLLCITPKCDSVRIGKKNEITPRTFSFAKLEKKGEKDSHDLIINVNGHHIPLATQSKFHKLIHLAFASNRDSLRVESDFSKPMKRFYFKDVDDCEYLWVGDLKDLHIQNRVSGLVGDLNRVGLDEFEWLRIKAKPKK